MKSITKKVAEAKFEYLEKNEFGYPGKDDELRKEILEIRSDSNCSANSSASDFSERKYHSDVKWGLHIYSALPPERIGLRRAADDGVWRYLSLEVLPDIVHSRWPDKPKRFYGAGRRLWLKSIWWYVHLSWQGDCHSTLALLTSPEFSTDTIVQTVERPGNGYRVELYREIMRRFPHYDRLRQKKDLLRAVMKINTAMLVVTEPEYASGGIPGYVTTLYETLGLHLEPNAVNERPQNERNELVASGDEFLAKKKYRQAFEYFSLAADQRNPEAHCRLALMYENGYGIFTSPGQVARLADRHRRTAESLGFQCPEPDSSDTE